MTTAQQRMPSFRRQIHRAVQDHKQLRTISHDPAQLVSQTKYETRSTHTNPHQPLNLVFFFFLAKRRKNLSVLLCWKSSPQRIPEPRTRDKHKPIGCTVAHGMSHSTCRGIDTQQTTATHAATMQTSFPGGVPELRDVKTPGTACKSQRGGMRVCRPVHPTSSQGQFTGPLLLFQWFPRSSPEPAKKLPMPLSHCFLSTSKGVHLFRTWLRPHPGYITGADVATPR